jgi:hypothetical protein
MLFIFLAMATRGDDKGKKEELFRIYRPFCSVLAAGPNKEALNRLEKLTAKAKREDLGEELTNHCLDSILNRSSNELRNDFCAARP